MQKQRFFVCQTQIALISEKACATLRKRRGPSKSFTLRNGMASLTGENFCCGCQQFDDPENVYYSQEEILEGKHRPEMEALKVKHVISTKCYMPRVTELLV